MNDMNRKYFNKHVVNSDPEDFSKVQRDRDTLFDKASTGFLANFFSDIKWLYSMSKDYYNGTYRNIPIGTIAAVLGTLIYVITPIDLIPDFIPVLGFTDDAACVAICLDAIKNDLKKYKIWKRVQKQ